MSHSFRTPAVAGSSLVLAGLLIATGLCRPAASAGADPDARLLPASQVFPDATGEFANLDINGPINTRNPFFQSLGTNGRSCVSCHQENDAWTITPRHLRERFEASGGRDPVFRTVDGSNSPDADVSTVAARRHAYSMLLTKGLIRIGLPIPATAEFTLAAVDDPYSHANAGDLSLFRRPLPATNLSFLTAVMWDGRESPAGPSLPDDLMSQADDAVLGHAQGDHSPTTAQLQQIVAFEMGQFTAQTRDDRTGSLLANGAHGGPRNLSVQDFFVGINDPLGGNPSGAPFDPSAFSLYQDWAEGKGEGPRAEAREAVARGEQLFNTRQFVVSGVGGLNDALHQPNLTVTCTTCHDSPNVGNHSVRLPLNIGLTDVSRRTPDLPLYTLANKTTGATVQTTDPGRALITGRWADIGKFKGPILRNLAARAPYFHNGSAATLLDAVNFYDTRFGVGFSRQEKADLVAFLRSL